MCLISLLLFPPLCVPKHACVELHIVHDLSFPDSSLVNDGISKVNIILLLKSFKLHLPDIDSLVKCTKGVIIRGSVFRKDLKQAFWQIPIDSANYPC